MLGLERTGGEKVVIRLADALHLRGHDVIIVVPARKRNESVQTLAKVVEIPCLPTLERLPERQRPTATLLNVLGPMARKLRNQDVIVANYAPTCLPAKLSRRKNARLWYLVQHDESLFFSPLSLEYWITKLSYGAFSDGRFFVVSNWLKDMVKDRSGCDAVLVPPGIDHTVYFPRPRSPHAKKEVLCMTRPARWRGIDTFLRAMEQVRRLVPDVRIVAIGRHSAPLETSIDVTYLTPSDSELAGLYSSCDVFVLPSLLEGLPVPPLEAMACAGPVVLTDCKGTRDYAVDGENCLMVPPGNSNALADAITRLLTDEELSQKLRSNGPKTAASWTYERMEQVFIAALES